VHALNNGQACPGENRSVNSWNFHEIPWNIPWKFPWKIPWKISWNSMEIHEIFHEIS
jgi:hypothetical protein